ncbi:type III PLP-dependent enzyme [Pacificimonas sp. WHA3]|uniref:Type III PLP-dependent enzyme n=1 Tax=Pacificimonas pallii TaxID=2827236 RepID=A0ABS6SEB5_9SPHN|nr:type III PLP-dependent enzyme [Pacificimonas pallii]MBV7256729.1 type III PLP-dependent enzyme [Pacificimonas pallii]
MRKYPNALGVAAATRPTSPVTLVRPHAAARAARYFVENFPGKSMYAVKANPSPDLLRTLWNAGITHYDVASINEVRLVRAVLPDATLCFMHPVKAAEAITESYFEHGVRTFSLDCQEELDKIISATGAPDDLWLCVRVRVSSEHAKLSLASKFGARAEEVGPLLMAARQAADALGVCFHVGSQAMTPQAYSDAIRLVRTAIVDAGVTVDVVDVGGGFPSIYPGMDPAPLASFFEVIDREYEDMPISYSAELWCEPGRALCAEYASVLVRVEQRRGDTLYINDGAYGSLFDAAHVNWRFPVELVRAEPSTDADEPFSFFGPTCDDIDHMPGPFPLPADVKAGDYIEIGMLGAYGAAMRTAFNGFGDSETVEVEDEPMASLYVEESDALKAGDVVPIFGQTQ